MWCVIGWFAYFYFLELFGVFRFVMLVGWCLFLTCVTLVILIFWYFIDVSWCLPLFACCVYYGWLVVCVVYDVLVVKLVAVWFRFTLVLRGYCVYCRLIAWCFGV